MMISSFSACSIFIFKRNHPFRFSVLMITFFRLFVNIFLLRGCFLGVSGFYVVKDEGFDLIRKRPVFTSRLDINQYSEGCKGSDTLFSRYPFSRSHNDIHSGQSRESDRKRKRKARRKPQSYRVRSRRMRR